MKKLGFVGGMGLIVGCMALMGVAVACSDDASSTNGNANNGADGGSTNPPGSNPGSNPGDVPGGAVKSGSIAISQNSFTVLSTTTTSYTILASFVDASGAATGDTGTAGASCTKSTEGDCTVQACDFTSSGGNDAGPGDAGGGEAKKSPNAGDITVTGATTVTLSPDGTNGTYGMKTAQEAIYADAASLTVDAKGADVPAFNTSLTPPAQITITGPELPALGATLAVDRADDLTFTWTGGAGDAKVTASLLSSKNDGSGTHTAIITCSFASSAGTGIVPAAALGKTVTGGVGTWSLSQTVTKTVDAGDWKVGVSASLPPTPPDGKTISGTAQFN